MLMYSSLLLLLPVFLAGLDSDPCSIEGESGSCVFIDACPALMKDFINSTNLTEETIRKFTCNNLYDFVCCKEPRGFATYGIELSDKEFCGFQHSDDYVPDTNRTSIDEFPWLAAIIGRNLVSGEEKIVCHGSIISPKHVLTAAQCFVGLYTRTYNITKVLLGEYQVKTETDCIDHPQFGRECNTAKEFGIEKIILHPLFHAKHALNDIALLKLNHGVEYSDYIRPICLPIKGVTFAKPGDTLMTTGWGKSLFFNDETTIIKKKIHTSLISHQECRKSSTKTKIPSVIHVICTTDWKNNTDFSCGGDAGAPVTFRNKHQWHIEGIVSRGGKCGEQFPGIHTRVSSYLEWIKQNIEEQIPIA